MTNEELRKKIADKFIEWVSTGELTKFLDDEAIPADSTICVTIDVKEITRKYVKIDAPVDAHHLVVAVRTRVDGKDRSQQQGHGKLKPGTYDYIEVSATP